MKFMKQLKTITDTGNYEFTDFGRSKTFQIHGNIYSTHQQRRQET
jgi:hypothetical protein